LELESGKDMSEQMITTINFHGTDIIVAPGDTPATTLIPMKPFVESMGLDWTAQLKRIKTNQILFEGMAVLTIPSAGGPQEYVALPLSLINGWMIGIQPGRIENHDKRRLVLHYQREAFDVLFRHFFGKAAASAAPSFDPMIEARLSALESGFARLAEGFAELARRPLHIEAPRARPIQRHFKPMRSILLGYGVMPTAKHDSIYRRCATACSDWCDMVGESDAYVIRGAMAMRTFDEQVALQWYREQGWKIVRDHRRTVKGQTTMKFPKLTIV
jgi:hypothetical protein